MMKQLLASASFLYDEVLKEEIDFDFTIKMKKPSRIPVVLSVREVERFLNSFDNLKHKALFTLLYSAGLRIRILLNLKNVQIPGESLML
jgi:site-specific recombinase XerD